MTREISKHHKLWLGGEGKNGRIRHDVDLRTILLPPHKIVHEYEWDISDFRDKWELIEEKLKG
jgi:hypothetical protein